MATWSPPTTVPSLAATRPHPRVAPWRLRVALPQKNAVPKCVGQAEEQRGRVQLLVYNMDHWGLTSACNKVMNRAMDGLYHAAVVVHGNEFWFDQRVDSLNLQRVAFARGFEPTHVYDMGATSLQLSEVQELVYGTLVKDYNTGTYNCFTNNCHHFANELCQRLAGKGVPQWCLEHGELGLSNLQDADEKAIREVKYKVGRLAMLAWGRFSRQRFLEKEVQQEGGNVVPAAGVVSEGVARMPS